MTDKDINPNHLLIIGAMKAGTSSLFEYLSQHPEICSSQIKEPEFFSSSQKHGLQVSRYIDLWPNRSLHHKYLMEASTGYTKYPAEKDVAMRIYESGIKPKLIYVVREPIARIESHFNFMSRKTDWSYKIDTPQLISVSDYYLQLSLFRKYFSREDIYIVDFDDLVFTPSIVLKKIYHFLGIFFHEPTVNGIHANETVVLTSTEKALKKLVGERLLKIIPRRLKQSVKSGFSLFAKRKKRKLNETHRLRVMECLKDNMLKLQDEYKVDVSKWGFKK